MAFEGTSHYTITFTRYFVTNARDGVNDMTFDAYHIIPLHELIYQITCTLCHIISYHTDN